MWQILLPKKLLVELIVSGADSERGILLTLLAAMESLLEKACQQKQHKGR
jgi:hypothetical protein